MFQFFDTIIHLLELVINFIVNLITMIIYALTFVFQGFVSIMNIIMVLPGWVLPFVAAVIAWSVVTLIINR